MGWIEKRKVGKPPHVCDTPGLMRIVKEGIDVGSVWECSTCKRRYRYEGSNMGVARYTEGYPI